jgi:hypothetical protein
VITPDGNDLLAPVWIERAIDGLPRWPHGPVRVVDVTRIGAEHGLSGQVYRVAATDQGGSRTTFIVKHETGAGIDHALAFHGCMGSRLRGSIPDCYGGTVDPATGVGILFLEDVATAVQGDVLIDPGHEAADAAIRVIAGVHAASWRGSGDCNLTALPRWHAEAWLPDRWMERLAGARTRFPEILTGEIGRSLVRLPDRLDDAIAALRAGPVSWIHTDAHLDNILWRPNGLAVLVDWAGAVIGPPAVDVARFLVEGPPGAAADAGRSRALIGTYERALEERGVSRLDASTVAMGVDQAMLLLAQGVIGWAGRPDPDPPSPRMAALRENALRNVAGWLSR